MKLLPKTPSNGRAAIGVETFSDWNNLIIKHGASLDTYEDLQYRYLTTIQLK